MPFGTPDAARILKSFLNNHAALVQKRRHRHARWATICSQPERGLFLSVARVSSQTDPLRLSSWCWPNRKDERRAWTQLYDAPLGSLFRLQSAQARLP